MSVGLARDEATVDVVVVTYNSARSIETCVLPLLAEPDVELVVVDNASKDDTCKILTTLGIEYVARDSNDGFAAACNHGWRMFGSAPYVLFLNPDAILEPKDLRTLVRALEADDSVGITAPRFVYPDGRPARYLRRFPRLATTWSRALFLHRLLPWAATDEVIHDARSYDLSGSQEWVPGACLLVRRTVLEILKGFDAGFFMYCEDKDFCKRAKNAGFDTWYEASATCVHEGGASAPRASLVPTLAVSRLRYARKHSSRAIAALHIAGLLVEAATRCIIGSGRERRSAHLRALCALANAALRFSDPDLAT
jgi:GT2 family glycosyltransferase